MYAILSKELGNFKDVSLVSRSLFTLAVEYKNATQEKVLTNDCKLGNNTFFDNLEVRYIEATASSLVHDKGPLEKRRDDLKAWCMSLREKQ